MRYLKGSPELLDDEKLDFIVKRVEHFMKDLNIPGLSVAISKKEQLKFAAGMAHSSCVFSGARWFRVNVRRWRNESFISASQHPLRRSNRGSPGTLEGPRTRA